MFGSAQCDHQGMFVVLCPEQFRYLEARAIIVLPERFGMPAINLATERAFIARLRDQKTKH